MHLTGRNWGQNNLWLTDYTKSFTKKDCHANQPMFIDASPGYLCHGEAAKRLANFAPVQLVDKLKLVRCLSNQTGRRAGGHPSCLISFS